MTDAGARYTDREIREVEKRIREIYGQAEKDIEAKMDDFNRRYQVKEAILSKKLEKGEITENQFNNWVKGQVFQGKQWQAKKEEIAGVLYNSNTIASRMINRETFWVFAANANYAAYNLEHGAGVNFGFALYDRATIGRLVREEPNLLPNYVPKRGKDMSWNSKKITRQITQGIIQGESLDKIGKRLAKETSSQNMDSMMTHARTLMTTAQNAGRMERYKEAEKLGIEMLKEWIATLDSHTRDSHASIDGEQVSVDARFSNGLSYPGEVGGPPAEVYNCRCTLGSELKEYPPKFTQRYDNESGRPISDMSYREWQSFKVKETAKNTTEKKHVPAQDFKWDKNYNGTAHRNYGTADTSDALYEIQNGKSNSLEQYMDENGNLTPDRIALHKQIIDNYLNDKTPEDGVAIMTMMGGGPASGKSSVLKSGLYTLPNEAHSITIDPDDIKQYLPGYLQLSKVDSGAASFYHEESSMLAKQLANTCFTENFNVTYDGTGDGSIGSVMKKINGAKEHGYKVNGMYVTVDIDEALKRNKSRYDHAVAKGESPRLVPDEYVINCHKKVTQISLEVSDKFDSISLYDNNGGAGDIKLIGIGGNGKKLSAVDGENEAFEAFVSKGK